MRVLFVGASSDAYGADAVLRNVAAGIQGLGHDVSVVLPSEGPGTKLLRDTGVEVAIEIVPVFRKAEANIKGLARLTATSLRGLVAAFSVKRRRKPDLIWVNTVTIPIWLVASRILRVPSVCHSHETIGGSRWLRRVVYLPLFLADVVVAVSHACAADIIDVYPRLAQRIFVALNPSFDVQGEISVDPDGERAIVLLGRISKRKGHAVLLAALDDDGLADENPTLHICGDPYDSDEAREFASSLAASPAARDGRVVFHGYVPTAVALSKGRIVVVPSTAPESCPLVVAEAIVARRIVVASDVGGVAELANGAARLIPPGDSSLLAAAIARLLADQKEREQLLDATARRSGDLSVPAYMARVEQILRHFERTH